MQKDRLFLFIHLQCLFHWLALAIKVWKCVFIAEPIALSTIGVLSTKRGYWVMNMQLGVSEK